MVECRTHPSLFALLPTLVSRMPGVTLDKYEEGGEFARIRLHGENADPRLEIFRQFAQAGIEIQELHRERVTLEDVFIRYTKTSPGEATPPAPAPEVHA